MSAPRPRRLARIGLVGALLSTTTAALAQPAGGGPPAAETAQPSPPDDERSVEARKAEGRSSFERGLKLFDEGAWDAALAEFVRSRAAFPTRAATKNAALCLSKLRRPDEALEMFEDLLRFSNLPDEDRQLAELRIQELEQLVGTLLVEGGEPGASLVIDGRYRGNLPLLRPIRLNAGIHDVRAYKEGFDPFGATVEVKGAQAMTALLRSMSTGGRIKVTEQRGRVLDVVLDGVVVGKTPWEGPATVGEHLVLLRGNVPVDASPECGPGGAGASGARPASRDLGTQPVSVPVRLQEVTRLTLTAEELDTVMRVEPTPAGATVAIDAVVVGRGTWEGRLRVGAHKVEVSADGFVPEVRRVTLERRKRQIVAVELERDRNSATWRATRTLAVGAAYGVGAVGAGVFAVTGSLALATMNDVRSRCQGTLCPPSEKGNIESAARLGTAATIGLVVAGLGVAAGTVTLFVMQPEAGGRAAPPAGAAAEDAGRRPGASGAAQRRTRGAAGPRCRVTLGLGQLAVEARF